MFENVLKYKNYQKHFVIHATIEVSLFNARILVQKPPPPVVVMKFNVFLRLRVFVSFCLILFIEFQYSSCKSSLTALRRI